MLRDGETAFPKKNHINWLSNTKLSALKTYTQNIIQTEYFIFRNMCIQTYPYVYENNYGKRGQEFGRVLKVLCWRIRREAREGERY